ncbi:MAG: hypothetical protein PHH54_03635 [Candidatus Nanoarchaeia archaeon]|nr:hypothetical protein [Candidatus Nanoarchaeia archaeon]MDD5741050.1 hypothetical protein [Candidatus Nanoarchaeia archaeon]
MCLKKEIRKIKLEESLKVWRKELRIDQKVNIKAKLLSVNFFSLLEHPLETLGLLLLGGGFVNLLRPYEKKMYKIVIRFPKFSNERTLVHELAHIKLQHEEMKKENRFKYLLYACSGKFDDEAENIVMSYKNLLKKRKLMLN